MSNYRTASLRLAPRGAGEPQEKENSKTIMSEEMDERSEIAARLAAALREEGFALYAQAIVPLAPRGDERLFYEVLVRFREEEEKLLPPGTFLPILEEYRLLPLLDRWVASRLARWVEFERSRKPAGWVAPRYAINLAPETLHDAGFGEYVRRHVQLRDTPAGTMLFEFTWDTANEHTALLAALAAELASAGCGITLSGFDGSDAAFDLVARLRPEFVKLDYGLIKDVNRALAASERVESVCARCRSLGIGSIAEFIENREILEQLRLIGVDYGQGLAIAPPLPLR